MASREQRALSKRPSGGANKAAASNKNNVSAALAAEAAEMEARLLELKKAMEAERAKRERAETATGAIWRNGAPGQLRPQRSKGSTSSTTPPISGVRADMTKNQAACAPVPTPPSAQPPPGLLRPRPSWTTPRQQAPPAAHSPTFIRTDATDDARPSLSVSRPVPVAGSLAHGTFDEAGSHGSFLEALQEWRAGARGAQHMTSAAAAVAAGPSTQETGVGAGGPGAAGPAVPKPVSYFDRLLLNSASRRAAQAAAGDSSSCTASSTRPGADAGAAGEPLYAAGPSSAPSQVYSLDVAMAAMGTAERSQGGGAPPKPPHHKGLDILEELERLEVAHRRAVAAYDSDEEWAAMLSPSMAALRPSGGQQAELVIQTVPGGMGLTRGARLPDAILCCDSDEERLP